jgi:integrase
MPGSRSAGLAKFVRFGERPPPGWTRINDSMFRVLQHSEEAKDMVLRGEYHMPPEAARVLNKNVWTTLRIMWNSALAWNYVTGELRVELPKSRKLRMRCYTIQEVKRMLANTEGADQVFFWLAAETRLRSGELIALRVSDVDLTKLSLEVSKAIWNGEEHNPKTEAGFRSVCISSRLGAHLAAYLGDRTEGYLFHTAAGNPWGASNVLERKLNTLLDRLKIPKIDPMLLGKIVGKDRTVE